MSERVTMYDLKNDVRSEVVNSFEEIFNSSSPERRLDELVDSYCPIYYADILECAISDFQLAVAVPEVYALLVWSVGITKDLCTVLIGNG